MHRKYNHAVEPPFCESRTILDILIYFLSVIIADMDNRVIRHQFVLTHSFVISFGDPWMEWQANVSAVVGSTTYSLADW